MVAIDQYGQRVYIPGRHPRQELLSALDRKYAERMYVDRRDGRTMHCGYVIAGRWLTLYAPVEVPA